MFSMWPVRLCCTNNNTANFAIEFCRLATISQVIFLQQLEQNFMTAIEKIENDCILIKRTKILLNFYDEIGNFFVFY